MPSTTALTKQPRREHLSSAMSAAAMLLFTSPLHSASERPAMEALKATPEAADGDPDIVSKI